MDTLHPDDIRLLLDVCRRIKGLSVGPGLTLYNGIGGISIGLAPKREDKPQPLASGPRVLIPVNLTADGGSDGAISAAPTYTYKWPVHTITGVEIKKADGTRATGLSPVWARDYGKFTRGTHGEIYINDDGDPVLWQVDEIESIC